MKIKNFTIITVILCLTSCSEEFLDLPPKTFVSSETFYTTPENFEQAVNGMYSELADLYENAYIHGEMRSDNTHYIYKANDRGDQNLNRENIDNFIDDALNPYTANKYATAFEGISKANTILTRLQGMNFSEDVTDRIKGQALFFRSFFYFELVQYFGGVPIYTEEVTSREDAFLPRSSKEEVYDLIIADATEAASLLPVEYPDEADLGRATKGAAHMLLGYAYMTLHEYEEAEAALRPILNMGYDLMDNYKDLYTTANENNKESIFEVQYKEGIQGVESNWTYEFIPPTQNTEPITGVPGNNELIGGWNTPTQDLIESYEEGDLRKEASIAEFYVDAEGNIVNEPYIIKYLDPHSTYNNTEDNWYVYRYADALLLLAQSLIEQNKTGEALQYINLVRDRADLELLSVTDQQALREIVAHERRVELAFENHRWLDLVRTGRAIEVMNEHGEEMKEMYDYLLDITYQVNEDKLIFPIPQDQLLLNENLEPNPGY